MGLRRTQNLRGGLLSTAPFHWDGSLHNITELIQDTFVHRMAGKVPSPPAMDAMAHWLDSLPQLPEPPVADAAAASRGKLLFDSKKAACSTCHSGEKLTDNKTHDVGTGGEFQAPSLNGLRNRAPYMHTGCAKTIRDRFDPACGGAKHGELSQLTPADVDDMIAYLESL